MIRSVVTILVIPFALAAPASAAERTVTLAVEHMTCELCPPIVKQTLARVPGVAKAEVSAKDGTATVEFDDRQTSVAALIGATTNAGYPSQVAGR